jgi:hypothetical protein
LMKSKMSMKMRGILLSEKRAAVMNIM